MSVFHSKPPGLAYLEFCQATFEVNVNTLFYPLTAIKVKGHLCSTDGNDTQTPRLRKTALKFKCFNVLMCFNAPMGLT